MPTDSKFSCESCGRSYAWKPQLAGKKVKCKCGQAMRVAEADPSAADADYGDLAALADGGAEGDHAPAAQAGPTCAECGAGLDENAVLCVNCGFNLKTGKKLGTKKMASKNLGTAATGAAGYISRGPKKTAEDQEPPPEKKQMMQVLLVAGLALVVAGMVVAGVLMNNSRKKRAAELAAKGPGRMERLLKITDGNEEGLVGAMKDGSILGAVDPRPDGKAIARRQKAERADAVNRQLEALMTQSPVDAPAYFQKGPTATMLGYDQARSKALLDEIMSAGATKVLVLQNDKEQGTHFLVFLPWDEEKRGKLFALQERLRTAHNHLAPNPADDGQKYLAILFTAPAG